MQAEKLTSDHFDCLEPQRRNPLAIFLVTKDRPMQAECCINSLARNIIDAKEVPLYILAKSSTPHIEKCYEEVVKQYRGRFEYIVCRHEGDFRQNFLDTLEHLSRLYEYGLYMTDDEIFYEKFRSSLKALTSGLRYWPEILTISLRLGENTTQQNPDDPSDIIKIPTKFFVTYEASTDTHRAQAMWNWREQDPVRNTGYPISLDGHLYRTEELLALSNKISFKNLREWEGELLHYVQKVDKSVPSYMTCFDISHCVNTSINMVQPPYFDKVGPHGKTVAELQQLYDDGYRVDLVETFKDLKVVGSHQNFPLKFKHTNCEMPMCY